MNGNDVRYNRTDSFIRRSFVQCVNKYGFEKTSITMICKNACIGRKTFYLHYLDKYDLLDKFFEEFEFSLRKHLDGVIINNFKVNNGYSSTEHYLDAIYDNRKDFLFLMNCSREKTENTIYKVVFENTFKKMLRNSDEFFSNPKNNLCICYMFTAMVAFTEQWLQNDDIISKSEAVELLFKLCEQPTLLLHEYFKK